MPNDIFDGVVVKDYTYNAGHKGTKASACTRVVERGTGSQNMTIMTVNTTIGPLSSTAATATAAVADGVLLYTFPAGTIAVRNAYMKMALVAQDGYIDADTPEIGLGTTLASGANATLGAVASTAENLFEGTVMTNCSGTNTEAIQNPTAVDPFLIKSGDAHTVYLNVADAWAASGELACPASGVVVIEWDKLD